MFKKNLSRLILAFTLAFLLFSFSMPMAAQAKSPALGSMAATYAGNYRLGLRRGSASFTVARRIMGGWEGTAVMNGASYYSNGIPQTNGTMIVNIFSLDANYNQVQVATLTGTFSADYTTFSGTIKMGKKSGSFTLKAQ